MADEYNSATNWWDSSRNHFDSTGFSSSSSSSTSGLSNIGSFSWPSEMVDVKVLRSSIDASSVSNSCSAFHHHNKLQQSHHHDSGSELHMMNLCLSSPDMEGNQALLENKNQSGIRSILQENLNSSSSFQQESSGIGPGQATYQQRDFSLDQPQFSPHGSSLESTVTCQGLQSGFQIHSTSLYSNSSTMLQGLLRSDNQQQQQQQSMNYPHGTNYCISSSSNDLVECWPKVPQFLRNSPPKQTHQNQLHFSNKAPFWNASASSVNNVRPSFLNSIQPQFSASNFEEKPKNTSQVRDSCTTVKKSGSEKRPRNETAEPIPAFKVRKEKMGDRITALQQLVSPFGRTDTASVLSEAFEYIKFLHEQVTVLSSPYMKSGAPVTNQQSCKDGEGQKEDLRSRGLCVVPLTSTFPVTHETSVDIWSPTFGGYR